MAEASVIPAASGFTCSISYMSKDHCDLDFHITVSYKITKQHQLQCVQCQSIKAESAENSEDEFLCVYHEALTTYDEFDELAYTKQGNETLVDLDNGYRLRIEKKVNNTDQISENLTIVSNLREFQLETMDDSPATIVNLVMKLCGTSKLCSFLENGYSTLDDAMRTFVTLAPSFDLQWRNLFLDKIDSKHVCFLCRKVSRKAISCPKCASLFCRVCILNYIEIEKHCYQCKAPLIKNDLKNVGKLKSKINQLEIKCPYQEAHVMPFRDFDDHLKTCAFRLSIPCTACGVRIIAKKDSDHNCYREKIQERMNKLVINGYCLVAKEVLEAEVVKNLEPHLNEETGKECQGRVRVWLFKAKTFNINFKLALPDLTNLSPTAVKYNSKDNPKEMKILVDQALEMMKVFGQELMDEGVLSLNFEMYESRFNLLLQTILDAHDTVRESDFFSRDTKDVFPFLLCVNIISPLFNVFVKNNCHVLVIGAHPGYLVTFLSVIIGSTGSVIGITDFHEDYTETHSNVSKNHADLLTSKRLSLVDLKMGQEVPKEKLYTFIIKKEGESYPMSKEKVAAHLEPSGWFLYINSQFPGIVAAFEKDKDGKLVQRDIDKQNPMMEFRKTFSEFAPDFFSV